WAQKRTEESTDPFDTQFKEYTNKHNTRPLPAPVVARQEDYGKQAREREYHGHNQALVYFNGKARKTISKSLDRGDFANYLCGDDGARIGLVPGIGAGTFSIEVGDDKGKLKVGVSICADKNRLVDYQKFVNVFILVACSVGSPPTPEKIVKEGGLFIYSDSREGFEISSVPP